MIVRAHMTPHPFVLRADSDVGAALASMQEHSIHHLPVLDQDDRVLGMVAERDLLLAALRYNGSAPDIVDVMHHDVISVRDDAPITHAATLMARNAIGGLPVVDARGRVVGIITERDIFRAFVEVLEAKTARGGISTHESDDELVGAPSPARRNAHVSRPAAKALAVARTQKPKSPRPKPARG